MKSILLAAKEKEPRNNKILQICKEENISSFDTYHVSEQDKKTNSIGIEAIRRMQQQLHLKPLSGTTKAILIEDAENLTLEAQQALLKILEEPPEHALFILSVSDSNLLLETIRSRCFITRLDENQSGTVEKDLQPYTEMLSTILSISIGDRFKIAQDASKTKDNATQWLEGMILAVRKELLHRIVNPTKKINDSDNNSIATYQKMLISLQKTYITVQTTNVSQRLALDTLLITI